MMADHHHGNIQGLCQVLEKCGTKDLFISQFWTLVRANDTTSAIHVQKKPHGETGDSEARLIFFIVTNSPEN